MSVPLARIQAIPQVIEPRFDTAVLVGEAEQASPDCVTIVTSRLPLERVIIR
jgi:hypothetical protein